MSAVLEPWHYWATPQGLSLCPLNDSPWHRHNGWGGHRACSLRHPSSPQMLSEKLFEQGAWAAPCPMGWHLGMKTAQPPAGAALYERRPHQWWRTRVHSASTREKGSEAQAWAVGSKRGWCRRRRLPASQKSRGHRWAKSLGGPPGNHIERVDGSEISRGHRALGPGSQFRTTGSSIPKPTHPQKPFPAFQPDVWELEGDKSPL